MLVELPAYKVRPAGDGIPDKWMTGTQNHEGIVGAAAAVDFLASLASGPRDRTRRESLHATYEALHARGEVLLAKMWNSLAAIDGLTLYGPQPGTPRSPTLSFTLKGKTTDEVAIALAKRGVFVSNGDFYAATVVERLGVLPHGLVRVGCSCYTSEQEVERLIDGVGSLV